MTEPKIFGETPPIEVPNEASDKGSLGIPAELQALIGEGKKYRDAETALKSIPHAQEHISSLEKTLEELRSDLAKREATETLLKRLEEKGEALGSLNEESSTLSQDSVEKIVESVVSKRENRGKFLGNIDRVQTAMIAKYGEKAPEKVLEIAKTVGLSVKELEELAGRAPEAFMKFFEGSSAIETVTDKSTLKETSSQDTSGKKNFEYYQKIRRENPTAYYSAAMQREVHETAKKMGQDFYK